jgi:hypothetical protein
VRGGDWFIHKPYEEVQGKYVVEGGGKREGEGKEKGEKGSEGRGGRVES